MCRKIEVFYGVAEKVGQQVSEMKCVKCGEPADIVAFYPNPDHRELNFINYALPRCARCYMELDGAKLCDMGHDWEGNANARRCKQCGWEQVKKRVEIWIDKELAEDSMLVNAECKEE